MKQVKTTYKYGSKVILPRQEKRPESQNLNVKRKMQFPFLIKAFKMAVVMTVIGMVVIAYVHQYAVISSANYKIQELEKSYNKLKAENERVSIDIASHKSLKHIEAAARDRLGLVEPNDVYFISTGQQPATQEKPARVASAEKSTNLFSEVGTWFRSLTSVEAGTLDG